MIMDSEESKKEVEDDLFLSKLSNQKLKDFMLLEEDIQLEKIKEDESILNEIDNISGNKLIHLSVIKGRFKVTKAIIDMEDDIDSTNFKNQTTLHLLMENINNSTINYLLEAGANPNIRDFNGNTPLHLAACKKKFKLIKLLLLFNADATITNNYGQLPINISQDLDDTKSYDALVKKTEEKYKKPFRTNLFTLGNIYIDQTNPGSPTKHPGSPIMSLINNSGNLSINGNDYLYYKINSTGQPSIFTYENGMNNEQIKGKGGHRSLYSCNYYPHVGIHINTDEYNSNSIGNETSHEMKSYDSQNSNQHLNYSDNKSAVINIEFGSNSPSPTYIYKRKKSTNSHSKNKSVNYTSNELLVHNFSLDTQGNIPKPKNRIYQKKRVKSSKTFINISTNSSNSCNNSNL